MGDVGPIEDDPTIVRIPQGIMTSKRMEELASRYRIRPKFVCKIPSDGEYIFTLDH